MPTSKHWKDNYRTESQPGNAGSDCAGAPGSADLVRLTCDFMAWRMNALLCTLPVALLCAAATCIPDAQFYAGMATGIWLSMWAIVGWAALVRWAHSPNTAVTDAATTNRPSTAAAPRHSVD